LVDSCGWGTTFIIPQEVFYLKLKLFNHTGIAGGYLFLTLPCSEPPLKPQYNEKWTFVHFSFIFVQFTHLNFHFHRLHRPQLHWAVDVKFRCPAIFYSSSGFNSSGRLRNGPGIDTIRLSQRESSCHGGGSRSA